MFAALQVWHSVLSGCWLPKAVNSQSCQGSHTATGTRCSATGWLDCLRLPPRQPITALQAWQSPVCSWSALGSAGPVTTQVLSLYSECTRSALCAYYYTLRSRPAPSRYPLAPCTCFQCIGVCRSAPVPRCQFRCVSLHTPSLSVLRCCIYLFRQLVVRNSFET